MKYIDVDSSKALDAYVREQCSSLVERISSHPNKYKLRMSVRPEARNKDGKIKSFHVEGIIVIPRKSDLRASKKGGDVKKAIESVVASLEKQVRRQTEKQERSRKTVGRSLKPVREFKWEMSLNSTK